MLKNHFPLGQFADIEAGKILRTSVGPHVFAVSSNVHHQKVDRVHSLGGQVVHAADQRFALAVFPGGVAGLPVV